MKAAIGPESLFRVRNNIMYTVFIIYIPTWKLRTINPASLDPLTKVSTSYLQKCYGQVGCTAN